MTLKYMVGARGQRYTQGKASRQALRIDLSREGQGQEQALRLRGREISVFLAALGGTWLLFDSDWVGRGWSPSRSFHLLP